MHGRWDVFSFCELIFQAFVVLMAFSTSMLILLSFIFSGFVLFFSSLTCSLVGAGGVFHEHVPRHLFGTRRSPSDHFQRDLLRTGVHLAIGEDKKKTKGDSLPTSLFPQIASRLMSAPCACSWRRRRSCRRRRKLCLMIFGWFAISFTSSFILWANTDSPQLLLTHIIGIVLTHTHNYQPAHPPAQMTKVSHGSGNHFTASAAAQRSACSSRQPMTGSFPGGTISLPEPPLSECTTAPVLSRRRPTQAQLKRAFRNLQVPLVMFLAACNARGISK